MQQELDNKTFTDSLVYTLKMQELFAGAKKSSCTVITQNIDGLHAQMAKQSKVLKQRKDGDKVPGSSNYAFTDHVVEIDGNMEFMRCSNSDKAPCCNRFYKSPNYSEVFESHVPKCKDCGKNMKIHAISYDDKYDEAHWRIDTVKNLVKDADALIVLGSALEGFLARLVVSQMQAKKTAPIIEISEKSSIDTGFLIRVNDKEALRKLYKETHRLKTYYESELE